MRWVGLVWVVSVAELAGCGGGPSAAPSAAAESGASAGEERAPSAPLVPPAPQASAAPVASHAPDALRADAPAAESSASPGPTDVFVNGTKLAPPDLAELSARLGQPPEPGRYWYDDHSGLWGVVGHGASGLTSPRLSSAPLPRDASNGKTGVLVNDRELTATELDVVARLLGWPGEGLEGYRGRYVLDDHGGLYGPSNRYLGNLVSAVEQRKSELAGARVPRTCVWLHLGDARGPLGRDARVACD